MKMRKFAFIALAFCLTASLASAQTFSTTLVGGAAEVPGGGDTDGSGIAVVTVNGTTINWTVLVNNITLPPTLSHIHRGAAGVAGPVVVNFNPTFVGGLATGTVTGVDQALINEIVGNPAGFYVNVHNADFPNGAIRGQLGVTTGAGARVSFIPVVGKVAGAAGTNFVTDLRIVNEGSATANVTLDYFQQSGAGQTAPTATRQITVTPGEQKVLDDIIGTLNSSNLGGLRITSDQNVTAVSRVINDLRASNQGTTGFATSARDITGASTFGTLTFLSQSSGADQATGVGFRTNIGYFNPSASPLTATFSARRSSDGTVLGTRTLTIPPFSQVQQGAFQLVNSVATGDQVQSNFYVSWTSNAPLFVYAAVVDNKTGDSVLVQ